MRSSGNVVQTLANRNVVHIGSTRYAESVMTDQRRGHGRRKFSAFHSMAHNSRIAYAAGFTGLGVGSTRFAAEFMLDHLSGASTARTALKIVRRKPLPFPAEPLASLSVNAVRWSPDHADHNFGRRNVLLRNPGCRGAGLRLLTHVTAAPTADRQHPTSH